ncbi:peptidoglycan-binding domain-containing protein [Marimonas arenosa]|uniref:Peptidoglycan-binding protein n=1 Tax=Marimonas arenosa TaxID=1795305 RepID=A0AAE4B435_9RHOB|nr:peptidoglycan-binding domain-containing protein [Marimonas arenosa]MDQ2090663.1 peptidoglycan-binding protein [Marimonas arenosa]
MKYVFNGLVGICLSVLAAGAWADDLALVISNHKYEGQAPLIAGEAAAGLAEDLKERGWTVFTARDSSLADMRQKARDLRATMQRTPEPDRVIIAITGLMAENDRDSWLLADTAEKPDMLNIGAQGLSLGALAEIAGLAPGKAVLMIGQVDAAVELGMGLRPGPGSVTAPQGVIVVQGQMGALRRWARDTLLDPQNSIEQALRGLPRNSAARGYSSQAESFTVAGERTTVGPMGEMAYWNAVRDIGSLEALQAYLNRFPAGLFAAEARTRLAELTRDPLDVAREAEEALGLTRNDRRQIQRNLALLGFDPRGIDGLFGRGSRAAIAAWQRSAGYEGNGFLTAGQVAELQRQAAVRAAELEREAQLRREAEERADRQFWQQLGRDEASLRRYLERYPDGLFAEDAQARLDLILEERLARAEARERAAWDRAQEANTIAAYRGFLDRFPNGSFAAEARDRIAELRAESENAAEIERLRKHEAEILPNQGARKVVEQILSVRGFKPGDVDGNFTRETRRAIRRFQRERGLPVTGFVSQQTMVVLMLSR